MIGGCLDFLAKKKSKSHNNNFFQDTKSWTNSDFTVEEGFIHAFLVSKVGAQPSEFWFIPLRNVFIQFDSRKIATIFRIKDKD